MDESSCKIVSIRGITKSLPNVIFINTDDLQNFIVPSKPFVLITGCSDATLTFRFPIVQTVLNHPNLFHWFAQNLGISHPKCSHIPIGIDYHSLSQPTYN